MRERILNVLKFWAPHGVVAALGRAKRARQLADAESRLAAASQKRSAASYEDAVTFLKNRGLDEHQIREGTIPEASLEFVAEKLREHVHERPPIAIHVGNFVGVSLAMLASTLVDMDDQSVVIAIDPNLTHRGIRSPQDHVLALLSEFGLQTKVMLVAGYSGSKSVSNDGTTFGSYDPLAEIDNERACENVLSNLRMLVPKRVDIAMMDGNHEGEYLKSEIAIVETLLRPGGVLVLDDVTQHWADIKAVYRDHNKARWEDLGSDGRVGILRLLG